MRRRKGSKRFALMASSLALSGCVTARLHSEAELADVGRECGLAVGELFQDESEKRLLFLFRIQPSPEQRSCVVRWARKNKLKTVIVDAINFPDESRRELMPAIGRKLIKKG